MNGDITLEKNPRGADLARSLLYEISGATLVANLIGYATIIMQIETAV